MAVLAFSIALAVAERPFTGTWKLNGAKCGRPARRGLQLPRARLASLGRMFVHRPDDDEMSCTKLLFGSKVLNHPDVVG
jgi:hypothetical protein